MKTIRTILFVAFAATTFISCQKELADNENINSNGKLVTFTASVNSTTDLKTAIHYKEGIDSFTTYLTDEDGISVNGVKSESVTPNADNTAITFDVEGVTGPYYAVTSRHDKGYDPETHTYEVQFSGAGSPQKHSMTESGYPTFDMKADILAAYGESENLTFHHLTTFYAISVDNAKIKSIYVRQGDGGYIAGQWNISFEGENMLPKLTPKSLSNVIGYDCGEEGAECNAPMIVGIPSFDYVDGLIFTLKDVNGNFASYKVPKEKAQHAADGGKIIPFKPDYNPGSGVIESVEDWEDFAAAINSGDDSKLYRWVGNGTVKLGAHISAKNLTSITKSFPYVFDGDGFSIERTKATRSLFNQLSGEIKNLTLKGELTLSDDGAPFVKNLCAGAKMTDCTNEMTVKINVTSGPFYIGGFAAIMIKQNSDKKDIQITRCINRGKIEGTGTFTANNGTVAIGGIVADIRAAGEKPYYDVVLTDCKNYGDIYYAPIPPSDHTTIGMKLCGIGGIAGYIRSGQTLTFDDCDNEGDITLSAEHMTNEKGMKAYAISMGGIIGSGALAVSDALTPAGFELLLEDCDNSGTLYNCGDNYSTSTQGNNKVYTGGLAGALVGVSMTKPADIQHCSNTGDIFTYDITSGTVVSQRPAYNAVAGGLIGYGGFLDIDDCTVNCQIGNGKRAMVAWGGMVGFLVKPFYLNNSNIHLDGYFQRISNFKYNIAVVGAVPIGLGTIAADLTGSKITGTLNVSGYVNTVESVLSTGTSIANLLNTYDKLILNNEESVMNNLVNGGKTSIDLTDIVTFSEANISYSAN